jgi:hypothetical protein
MSNPLDSSEAGAVAMPIATNSLEQEREASKSLLDVRLAAKVFGVSTSWIRRHITELPTIRVGRFIRFDAELLSEQLRGQTGCEGTRGFRIVPAQSD